VYGTEVEIREYMLATMGDNPDLQVILALYTEANIVDSGESGVECRGAALENANIY